MTTYSMMDVLMASPTEPLPEFKRRHQLTIMLDALRNLEQAPNPTNQDWDRVNNAVVMMEALRDMGHVEDPDGLLDDAIEALGKAGFRSLEGQKLRLGMRPNELHVVPAGTPAPILERLNAEPMADGRYVGIYHTNAKATLLGA